VIWRLAPFVFAAYVGTIWLANWLIVHVGVVGVGFGLVAPAGVFAAGIALTLRDILQLAAGRVAVVAAIVTGALLSVLIAPSFALALGAVALSNTVGLLLDSWLFLTLAFGSLAFFWGQVVGKAWMTLLAVGLLSVIRSRAVLARNA
jgi:uncharacterized PurR-regulated membrane protein YhhQ (DUF165 family)